MEENPISLIQIAQFSQRQNALMIFRTQELRSWWNAVPNEWREVLMNYVKVDKNPTPEQLHKVTSITAINITDNSQIRNLSPLQKFIKLRELRFSNTSISNLAPIKGLQTLQLLQCSKSPIGSLNDISNLRNLEHLECENTAVSE